MTLTIGAAQIVWVVIAALALIVHTVEHGKPRKPYNAFLALIGTLIEVAVLYWGGFFS